MVYPVPVFRDRRVAAVIPCYAVAASLGEVLGSLPDFIDEVIVVDDGSPDDVAKAIAEAQPARTTSARVTLLRHPVNRGLAAAMATGFHKALELGADIVVKIDGDGQMDPAHTPALLLPIVRGEADFTKGNRFMHRKHLRGMPRVRLVGNLGLSFLSKAASGYWNIFDPTNGFLALRRELLAEIDLDRLGPRYFFETSLLVEAYLAGAVVKDVSIPSRYGDETSSLSVGRSLAEFPWRLLKAGMRRIALRYFLRDFTPVALFLLLGLALSGWGLVFGVVRWMQHYGSGIPTPTGTIILAVLPLLMGFQLLLQAAVMDIQNVPQKTRWPEDSRPPTVACQQSTVDAQQPEPAHAERTRL